MIKPLYYFTIDLIIEEYDLSCPEKIANKVFEEFGEVFSPLQIQKYIGEPKKKQNIKMKEIFG